MRHKLKIDSWPKRKRACDEGIGLITDLLHSLCYKSEGTDIDFKSQQYHFVNGTEESKAEMLKDILAVANAWRDGTGYILIGFRDRRPHPAEPVGITSSIDDASLQQFVHSKVRPKLGFSYEEHLYESKTIGLIAIPKQQRAFYLAKAYGHLKSNVVYVRRGSSTDEAEPPEIVAMALADSGRGEVRVELSLRTPGNEELPSEFVRRFICFTEELPDYDGPRVDGPFGMSLRSPLTYDNRDFWRECAEFTRVDEGLVLIQVALRNSSAIQLSSAKLEVTIEGLQEQGYEMLAGADVPEAPRPRSNFVVRTRDFPALLAQQGQQLVVDHDGPYPVCRIRFGTLLPGEESRAPDMLGVLALGPGGIKLRFRILASELATPQEVDRTLSITGDVLQLDVKGLQSFVRDRLERIDSM